MKFGILATLILCTVATTACDRDRMSEKGFRLPDGDPVQGKQVFLNMQCHECHTVSGMNLPVVPLADPPYIELGGKVTHVRTYGELVTAIINPSHKLADGYPVAEVSEDGKSKMTFYNGYMTVQQLIDIVMFLQPQYEVAVPDYEYPTYWP